MPKKQKQVYVKDTVFTQSELDYINKCQLSVPYDIDVTRAAILIPPDHADSYRDNLHVLHLINQFGFSAQITIGATLRAIETFNPVMRTASVKSATETNSMKMPKRGEIWVHSETKQRYYFDKVDKDSMRVKFLNSLINDKTFKISDIDFLVANGHLSIELK